MARRKVSIYAKCPFYRNENGARICCKGIVEGTYIHQNFPDADLRKRYQRQFCKANWEKCLLAIVEVEIEDREQVQSP